MLWFIHGAATLLSSCSSAQHPGPKGDWDRLEDGDLLLAVPKGWDLSVAQSSIWGTKWTDPSDKSAVLMTAQSIKAKDGYDALDLAMNAARAVTRGYQPIGSRTAVTDGSIILAQQQYQTTWPYQKKGPCGLSAGSRRSASWTSHERRSPAIRSRLWASGSSCAEARCPPLTPSAHQRGGWRPCRPH